MGTPDARLTDAPSSSVTTGVTGRRETKSGTGTV
jgi:hypothetical protein